VAVDDILRSLQEEAEEREAAIMHDAEAQILAVKADADAQAAVTIESRLQRAAGPIRARGNRVINAARLEARHGSATEKEHAIDRVYAQVEEGVRNVRTQPDYSERFETLMREATEGLDGPIEVHVDPADEALAVATARKIGGSIEVHADLSTAGGVVATMDGGRISRRNTFEDRLAKLRSTARADVARLLFP
jgi:vacuolar-type H+-ATPase subunit E/Vma4